MSFTGPDGVHHTLVNHNRLVADGLYPGANGFKTGFTNKAQHTLVATATRGSRTLIVVILGTYDAYGWATRLLDVGLRQASRQQGTGETLPPAAGHDLCGARALQFAAMRRLDERTADDVGAARYLRRHRSTSSPKASAPAEPRAAAANPTALAANATAATRIGAGGGGGLSGKTIVDPDRGVRARDALRAAGAGGAPRPCPAARPAAGDQRHDATRRAPGRRRSLPDRDPRREAGRVTRPAPPRCGIRRRQRLRLTG